MSASSGAPTQASFLGLDLASLGRDLLAAWRGMLDWPLVSWLWPKSDVRVWLSGGGSALSRGLNTVLSHDDKSRVKAARFEAILLPENLLLRRTITLPQLQAAQVQAALSLEIQSLSPFTPGDAVWAHHVSQQNNSGIQAQVIISSKKLIAQHIAVAHPQLTSSNSEVWVSLGDVLNAEAGFVALPGFGGAGRDQQNTSWRWVSGLLLLTVLSLLAGILLTPTIRIYLMSVQASHALEVVAKKANPAVEQRELLLRLTEQVASLDKLVEKPIPPLRTLLDITQALPDDTFLMTLQIQGLKVTMNGQTSNAAALMKQLGSTPGLRDVRAPTAATKPLGATREQFTIEFVLDAMPLKVGS